MSPECRKKLSGISVAVVGGGLAGLMAARELGRLGIKKLTVFEARHEVGGRVKSNHKFSEGRIIEEGAELVGSFHTTWLSLAQEYGLAMISRMDEELYWRANLEEKLTLDKPLSRKEIEEVNGQMRMVLEGIAKLARDEIKNPAEPWLETDPMRLIRLKLYDAMSVGQYLTKRAVDSKVVQYFRMDPVDPKSRLWKMLEFRLVNDEVEQLDTMNLLGLLCKVKAGQGDRFGFGPEDAGLMAYWKE